MPVPFEALLPYGIMLGVRRISAARSIHPTGLTQLLSSSA